MASVATAPCPIYISHIGARISIPDSETIPDNFVLFLAENGSRGAVGRKPRELGVKFEMARRPHKGNAGT
jgi:hypothetical protein